MRKTLVLLMLVLVIQSVCGAVAIAADTDAVIEISTNKTSNVFFDSEQRIFNVTLTNNTTAELKLNIIAKVLSYDKAEVLFETEAELHTVAAGSSKSYDLNLDYSRYGAFDLQIEAANAETDEVYTSEPTDFCIAKASDGAADPVGFGVNPGQDAGYNDIMKMAGVGNIRIGACWYECVDENGVFTQPKTLTNNLAAATTAGLDICFTVRGNNLALFPGEKGDDTGLSVEDKKVSDDDTVPVSDEAQQGFVDFVMTLLKNSEAYNITSLELWNEPNIVTFNKYGKDDPGLYAKLLSKVYTAVKAEYPQIRVVGISASWMGNEMVNSSKTGWIDKVLYADTDGDGQADGYNYLDDVSVHHYITHTSFDTEANIGKLRARLDELGKTNARIERTEFGASRDNDGSAEKTAEQIQYYLKTMVNKEVTDNAYIYTFVDDNHHYNDSSFTYGLINKSTVSGESYGSAKPSFPMVCNANSLISGYTAAKTVTDTDTQTVYKFTRAHADSDDEIIVFFSRDGSGIYEFTPTQNQVRFFDAYGNLIAPSKNGNVYSLLLTKEPIYAKIETGANILASASTNNGIVSVTVTLPNVDEGDYVSARVLDQNSKPHFLEQLVVDSNNQIVVNIGKVLPTGTDYSLWLGAKNFSGIYKTDLIGDDNVFFYLSKIDGTEATIGKLSNGDKLKLGFVESTPLDRYVVICSGYNGSILSGVKVIESDDMIFDGKDSNIILNYSDFDDYDKIRFYLFDSINNIIPLSTYIAVE